MNVSEIPIEQVKVTGLNPRKEFDKGLLEELAQSIKEARLVAAKAYEEAVRAVQRAEAPRERENTETTASSEAHP